MSTIADEALRGWLSRQAARWRQIAALSGELARRRARTTEEAFELAEGYRSVARDLSMARRLVPESRTRHSLETLYRELHATLHRPASRAGADLLHLFRFEIPAELRQLRVHVVAIVALLVLSTAAGAWLIRTFPELVSLVLDEYTIQQVEAGELWTDNLFSVVPPSLLSIDILTNNITVTLFAFCAGIFFGLGTFYIIANNGLMIGALFAFTAQHDVGMRLFEFVIAHGIVEISVICIAGAAGASVGEALARPPDGLNRREAFRAASARSMKVMLLCALLLVGCGFIEGYVSPNPTFPLASRVAIGVGYGVIMLAALSGDLFGRKRAQVYAGTASAAAA